MGTILEGGAGWHQSWLQKGRVGAFQVIRGWGTAAAQVPVQNEHEREGLGEGPAHHRGVKASAEENKKGPLLQTAVSQLCGLWSGPGHTLMQRTMEPFTPVNKT